MITFLEFLAAYGGWVVILYLANKRYIKRAKREIKQEVQKALFVDRQIRSGKDVGAIIGIGRSRSGSGSVSSGRGDSVS